MPPQSRNKYSEQDDRLMWKYFISRLKKKDPACEHPSLQFWEDFRVKYNWDRDKAGIESHFRKQLKGNIHKSGLKDRYLFTAMKLFKTQLNLMDYDELERKHNCIILKTDNMIFKRALRGNTEISKLPAPIDDDDDEEHLLNPRREHVFEGSSDSESDLQQTPLPQIAQNSNADQATSSSSTAVTNPFTQMRLNWRQKTLNVGAPTTSGTVTASPTRNITLRKRPAVNSTPTKDVKKSPNETSVANRTRSSTHSTPAKSPTPKKSRLNADKSPQNEPLPSTSHTNQPTLAQIKTILIERMQKILKGELEAKQLDNHPLLVRENVKGFEKMLRHQKLMLAILMSKNNQLKYFDVDYRPKIEKQKLIPPPKLIKIEQIDSADDAESIDNDLLVSVYDSTVEER